MGPRDNRDFVGGNAFWALGASLVTPIYKKHDWPLKGHFFVNAGKLVGAGDFSFFHFPFPPRVFPLLILSRLMKGQCPPPSLVR